MASSSCDWAAVAVARPCDAALRCRCGRVMRDAVVAAPCGHSACGAACLAGPGGACAVCAAPVAAAAPNLAVRAAVRAVPLRCRACGGVAAEADGDGDGGGVGRAAFFAAHPDGRAAPPLSTSAAAADDDGDAPLRGPLHPADVLADAPRWAVVWLADAAVVTEHRFTGDGLVADGADPAAAAAVAAAAADQGLEGGGLLVAVATGTVAAEGADGARAFLAVPLRGALVPGARVAVRGAELPV